MHRKNITTKGKPVGETGKAVVLLHGRGGSSGDMLAIASKLWLDDYTVLAPQATRNTWYPYSFLMPEEKNQPWLESALDLLSSLEAELLKEGVLPGSLYFGGFSQGACLSLEYAARNAKKYGGVLAFTGGLIGESVNKNKYRGDFQQTPVFIGSSDPDSHIPVERVRETELLLKNLNAKPSVHIYPGIGHTIIEEEIETVNQLFFS